MGALVLVPVSDSAEVEVAVAVEVLWPPVVVELALW